MSADAAIGVVILVLALGMVTGLVLRSRGAIDRIARRGERSAREILHDDR